MPKVRFNTKQSRAQAMEQQLLEREMDFRIRFQAEAEKQMKLLGVKKQDLGQLIGKERATGYNWINHPERLRHDKLERLFTVLRFSDEQRQHVMGVM